MVIVEVWTTIITSVSSSKKQQLNIDDRAGIKFATIVVAQLHYRNYTKLLTAAVATTIIATISIIDIAIDDWRKEKMMVVAVAKAVIIIVVTLSLLYYHITQYCRYYYHCSRHYYCCNLLQLRFIITFHLQPLFPFNTAIRTIVAADIYYYHFDCYILHYTIASIIFIL